MPELELEPQIRQSLGQDYPIIILICRKSLLKRKSQIHKAYFYLILLNFLNYCFLQFNFENIFDYDIKWCTFIWVSLEVDVWFVFDYASRPGSCNDERKSDVSFHIQLGK